MPHWEKTSESTRLVCICQLLPFFLGLALQRAMPHLVPVLHHQGLGTSWSVTHNHPSLSAAHRPLGSNNWEREKRTGEREKRCIAAYGHTPNTAASKSCISEWPRLSGFTDRHWEHSPRTAWQGQGQTSIPNWPACQEPLQCQKWPSTPAGSQGLQLASPLLLLSRVRSWTPGCAREEDLGKSGFPTSQLTPCHQVSRELLWQKVPQNHIFWSWVCCWQSASWGKETS